MRTRFAVLIAVGLAILGPMPRAQCAEFGIGVNPWAGGAPPSPAGIPLRGPSLRGPLNHVPHETYIPRGFGGADPLGSSWHLPTSPMLPGPHGAATDYPAKPAIHDPFGRGLPPHPLPTIPLVPHGLPVCSLQGMPLPGLSPHGRSLPYVPEAAYSGYRFSSGASMGESSASASTDYAPPPNSAYAPAPNAAYDSPSSPAYASAPSPAPTPYWAPMPPGPRAADTLGRTPLRWLGFFAASRSQSAASLARMYAWDAACPKPFTPAWHAKHPKAWHVPAPASDTPIEFTVAAAAAWMGTHQPVSLVMTPTTAPAATFDAGAARNLAQSGSADVAADGAWMRIGAFACKPLGDSKAKRVVSLALNPQGVVRGCCYDLTSDDASNISGAVDKKDLRIAWTVGSSGDPVFQTPLTELAKPQGAVNAFARDDQIAVWQIRPLTP